MNESEIQHGIFIDVSAALREDKSGKLAALFYEGLNPEWRERFCKTYIQKKCRRLDGFSTIAFATIPFPLTILLVPTSTTSKVFTVVVCVILIFIYMMFKKKVESVSSFCFEMEWRYEYALGVNMEEVLGLLDEVEHIDVVIKEDLRKRLSAYKDVQKRLAEDVQAAKSRQFIRAKSDEDKSLMRAIQAAVHEYVELEQVCLKYIDQYENLLIKQFVTN